jgi:hypothetical protein
MMVAGSNFLNPEISLLEMTRILIELNADVNIQEQNVYIFYNLNNYFFVS